jgi:LysM repeat protein
VFNPVFPFWKKVAPFSLSQEDLTFWSQMSRSFTIEWDAENPYVQKQIHWYRQHPKHLSRILNNAKPFIQYVYEQTRRKNLPAELALIPLLESQYNSTIATRTGAGGFWQMMPGTAVRFGLKINSRCDQRHDLPASTKAALSYLSYLYHHFNRDWLLALAAYEAGEGRIESIAQRKQNFWDLPLREETKEYVPKLLAIAAIIRQPKEYNFKPSTLTCQLPVKKVRTECRKEKVKHVSVRKYKIRKHDTLDAVAKKFHASIRDIKKANHLRHEKQLQIGRTLIIPVENKGAKFIGSTYDRKNT